MIRFTNAVRSAVKDKNWYSALTLALTLPDICGRLENPNSKSGARYVAWWNKYLLAKYSVKAPVNKVFLSGDDAYALRCAYLHEGGDDVTEQKAQDVLTRFMFIEPWGNNVIHNNLRGTVLQLQVDKFCDDICTGVDKWTSDTKDNNDVQERAKKLLFVKDISKGGAI